MGAIRNSYGSDPERSVRQPHRLTTHSLRHYTITSFAKHTNGNLVLTSRFASPRKLGMIYVALVVRILLISTMLSFTMCFA